MRVALAGLILLVGCDVPDFIPTLPVMPSGSLEPVAGSLIDLASDTAWVPVDSL